MRFWGIAFLVTVVVGVTMPDPLGWLLLAAVAIAGTLCMVNHIVEGAETVDRADVIARSTPRIPVQRGAVD